MGLLKQGKAVRLGQARLALEKLEVEDGDLLHIKIPADASESDLYEAKQAIDDLNLALASRGLRRVSIVASRYDVDVSKPSTA